MTCLVCGCEEKEIISKLCSNMKILHKCFKEGDTYVVSCKKCGNTYVDISAEQKDFNEYYKSDSARALSYYEVYGEEPSNKYFTDILNKFQNLIDKNSQIVDVASGVGDFSLFLKNKGYKNVYGLDIDETCIKSLKEKGINAILSDTIHLDKTLENKFDLAVFGHSLEHYFDYRGAVLSAKKMLKKDGYLYIEVPDASKYSDIDAVPYTMFTYEHTFHATQNTMKNFARAYGLKLIDTNTFYKAGSYWVLYGLFQNNGEVQNTVYDNFTQECVRKYAQESATKVKEMIKPFEESKEKLILWGIGASTAFLLNDAFNNCNVDMLIDRNPARQGLAYNIGGKNITIKDPKDIKDSSATIVILPYWYKNSISKQIKEMGFKNKVVALS